MQNVGPQAGWQPYSDIMKAKERLLVEIDKPHQFALELKKEHKVIGSIEVMDVKREKYKGVDVKENAKELGSILSEKYWGKGYMPEAVMGAVRFCFDELHVDAVYACYLEKNRQSERMREKTGFSVIGRVPNHRKWTDGQISDLIIVMLSKEEYENGDAYR